MTPPQLDLAALRAAGRQPATPFGVRLDDGSEVVMLRLLRVLPGKRIVGEARWRDQAVLAKLFIGEHAARHGRREVEGVEALQAADLPTPPLLAHAALAGGGYATLSTFLAPSHSLAAPWRADLPEAERAAWLSPALELVARLHRAGLVQDDLHLGNFLAHDGRWYLIDGDAVRRPAERRNPAHASTTACDNLAVLLAQLPPAWDDSLPALLEHYRRHNPVPLAAHALRAATDAVRHRRLADLLAKSVRDCTLYAVRRTWQRFCAAPRTDWPAIAPLLDDPDAAMATGLTLKDGGTATVVRVAHATLGNLVIKRYNLKHWRHALSRLWRPSRAWHSWQAAVRLHFYGVATPRPLGLAEARFGPLRRQAWLVTAHCGGTDLLRHLDPARPPGPAEADALRRLFDALNRARITHGDLKATNLLWHDGEVVLIDLDAVRQHDNPHRYARAWQRDRRRLLRNWPADSALYHWLDTHLPR